MGQAGWEGITNVNTTGIGERAGRGYVAQEHVAGVKTKRVAFLGLDSSREAGEDITREEQLACARPGSHYGPLESGTMQHRTTKETRT
ncbi:hypothetical protein [Arthrobacter sp. SO3]|uniref:hypothetical protein n=1 Tax=Arthrobacter sp. SO3 TaxID=1897057 RepID=UPI001CFF9EE0|nr:hypothetical protein [Arthrobacter sp. SO3]MCB5294616.1 hypothetical protein [Arthrobacter sp. SO3]